MITTILTSKVMLSHFYIMINYGMVQRKYMSLLNNLQVTLLSLILFPILVPFFILSRLFARRRYLRMGYPVGYSYRDTIVGTMELICIGCIKLGEFAKLRFTKQGRAERIRLQRVKLWNEENYCGEY